MQSSRPVSERGIIFLISAVQVISVLEFMIVMPLGPDFGEALGIHPSKLGTIGGAYTAAAAISGILSSLFIERFDRRKALAFAMFALVAATAAAGLAYDLTTLLLARVAAGCFGGPAMSIALAIIADTIPPERRGRAMGTVMASFAISSVIGVPAGLELAHWGGWRLPFFAISALGIAVIACVFFYLPTMRGHIDRIHANVKQATLRGLLSRPAVRMSLLMTAFAMMGMFMLIPNIPAYVQENMGYPRNKMGILYLVGGLVSFVIMRSIGKLVDKRGAVPVASAGTIAFVVIIFAWFILHLPTYTVLPLFVLFMASSSFRNVPYQTMTSKIPLPHERARFMAVQSSVQHIFTTAGAFLSSMLLSEGPNNTLQGMNYVGALAILFIVTMPFMMHLVEKRADEPLQTTEAVRRAS